MERKRRAAKLGRVRKGGENGPGRGKEGQGRGERRNASERACKSARACERGMGVRRRGRGRQR
eukprot:6200590-Pleurochrysis_carterae.AAC.5